MNLYDYEPRPEIKVPDSYRSEAFRLARKDDHDTSKEAAEHISDEAKLAAECDYALKCIRENPGWTQNELDREFANPENPRRVGQRCKDLVKQKLIRFGKKRPSRVSGMMSKTWWPVESMHPDSYPEEANS